jgi:hypothetical protein
MKLRKIGHLKFLAIDTATLKDGLHYASSSVTKTKLASSFSVLEHAWTWSNQQACVTV